MGLHPYSNLTCISSWHICIPNIIWIHLTITEKMNGNCHYQECDGRTNGRTEGEPDGHHHTIIRPVFNGRIKRHISTKIRYCTGPYGWLQGSK
jgi:hypothetical protein